VVGVVVIILCTLIIYAQTIRVRPLDYEDPFYLLHSPYVRANTPFSSLTAVWSEPYFANFHPVTTTTWLVDRALGKDSKTFDGFPFRASQLLYAILGASLLIPLYRRLGIPVLLSSLGALVYAAHPIHTEVVAWLSARKDLTSLIFIILSVLSWLWARTATTPGHWRVRHAVTSVLALLAVLSKPIAVILPALFVAYEFCSDQHGSILGWRFGQRDRDPVVTRTLALTATFFAVGGLSTAIFRSLLLRNPMHGGWLIFIPMGLMVFLLAIAPSAAELGGFRHGATSGIKVLGRPFVVLSVVFGSGSAWTFWAQGQVGAIKGGLALLPTLNLTFEAILAYAGKAFVPIHMSASYSWSEYPNVSAKGILGVILVCAAVWGAMRVGGSHDQNRRLIAFGIFWYLIALVPVSNLVPTSTKMADRYLFVPTVGSILAVLALATLFASTSRRDQIAVCSTLLAVTAVYTAWSYSRTEVWCGKTTPWNGTPHPDLSLWTAAVETNPGDNLALTNLGLTYLRLVPPEADKALVHLNRALELGESNQSKIAGDRQLVLSPLYEALGDGYLTRATQLVTDKRDSQVWEIKKQAAVNAVRFFRRAVQTPSGFAPGDARVLSRLAEASEGQAQMDAQELADTSSLRREALISERDQLRYESEGSMERAVRVLSEGHVAANDPNYQAVILGQGNIIFGREAGATSNEEKEGYYFEALRRYKQAAALLPDDPRPILYEGLCYERLTLLAKSPEEKQRQFRLGEQALRKSLTMTTDAPDYSSALPYQELAALYAHVNDYPSVLESLKNARQANPPSAVAANLDREIQSVQQYLASNRGRH
jgi:tetratricopeptide (TPR) repeat protein